MSSLLEHCHGEKTHFSRNEGRTFPLSRTNNAELVRTLSWWENALFEEWERMLPLIQMNNVELARALSWRVNALFEERGKNAPVKPNEQCRACSSIVMASKRTFRGTRKNSKTHQSTNSSTQKLKTFVFILQWHIIFHSVLAKIGVKK